MASSNLNRKSGIGSPASLITISKVTSLTLVAMVLVLTWGRMTHNNAAESEDSLSLRAAAEQALAHQTSELRKVAQAYPATSARDAAAFTRLFVVDIRRNAAIAGLDAFGPASEYPRFAASLKPALDSIAARPAETAEGAMNERQLFTIVEDLGYAVSIVRTPQAATSAERHLALVGVRATDADFLNRLAANAGIGALGIVREPSGNPALSAIALPGNGAAAFLEWRADRPGDRMVGHIGTMLVSFAALFAGLLAWRTTTELADSESDAKRLAGHDLLSGLPNRLLFTDILASELERQVTEGGSLGVFYIDLDRFKEINDSFGHEAGDRLIVAVARRMQETLRATDVVARFGGDEFAILQPNVKSNYDAEQLARRLLAALREPFDIGDNQVRVGASIGLAIGPGDSAEVEGLLRCADLALYRAKSSGRNRYMVFNAAMTEQAEQRRTTEQELRLAIERDELVVLYQPIVSIDGKKLMAVEALVRWKHPIRGMVPPSEFIPLAESRGLILPLGEYVLRRACKDARFFNGIRVAVNVSAIQFRHRNFVKMVEQTLAETELDPARLELELTEGVVVEDADEAENAMIELRGMGVRLALDDFGTGYSSLIYLRRFAFDKIKIDKSFLEAVESTGESAIIVHSVVHLGRALGLTVVAEGVETPEQHRFLQALGAHELQGFLFSRPVPADEIIRICENDRQMPAPKPVLDDVTPTAQPAPFEPLAGAA